MLKKNELLFNEATGGDGGAGGGAGSILTSSGGGGGTENGAGNGNSSQPPASNQTSGGNSDAVLNQGNSASDWRSSLPKELQEDASLKKFTSVHALAGAYLGAQKLIGRDKISVPTKESGDEEWKAVYQKLGLPEDPKSYEVKFKDNAGIDKDFTEQFKNEAYKLGILPKQSQALADWFSDLNVQAMSKMQAQAKEQQTQQINGLKQEWGDGFKKNVAYAQQVVNQFADDSTKQYLEKSGIGNDVNLIKFLSKLGENMYKEGKIVGEISDSGLTPGDAKDQITKIMGDKNHPYWIKGHPGHKSAIEEVQRLNQVLYPGDIDKK